MVGAAWVLGVVLAGCGAPDPPRNVILITVDTLRADRIGAYGYESAGTPRIDSLAERGTLFRQATTPFPRTTPAIASLFTGLRPEAHGSREVFRRIENGKLMAEILGEAGYRTLGVSANRAAGADVGLAVGFDVFDDRSVDQAPANRVTDRALAMALDVAPTVPLFLWVHYIDPHWPYRPPGGLAGRDASACGYLRKSKLGLVYSNHQGHSERLAAACSAAYDAEVSYVDSEIGRLLDRLEASGHIDGRSLVILTSDHGENLGEDRLYYEHGPSVDDASVRVPLIVSGPGLARGELDRGVARLEDLLPTVLNLLDVDETLHPAVHGIDLSPRLQGRRSGDAGEAVALVEGGSSLRPRDFARIVSGKAHDLSCTNGERLSLCGLPGEVPGLYDHERDPELLHDLTGDHPEARERLERARERWPAERARERAIRTERFRLVQRPLLEGGYSYTLYERAGDGNMHTEVTGAHPEVVTDLSDRLKNWIELLEASAPARRTPEELEAHRALGYVE